MKVHIIKDNENRITAWGTTPIIVGGVPSFPIELPIYLSNLNVYKYENGNIVKDVEYEKQLIAEQEAESTEKSLEQRVRELESLVQELLNKEGTV